MGPQDRRPRKAAISLQVIAISGPNGQEVIHMFQAVPVSGRAKKEDGERVRGSLLNAKMAHFQAAGGRPGFVVPGPETDCRKPLWLPYSWLFPKLS
jgi:hypothetical protein